MGRVTLLQLIVGLCWFSTTVATAATNQELLPEITDPKALAAYDTYWDAFESYEAKNQAEGTSHFQESWQKIRSEYSKEHLKLSEQQLKNLQQSASKYRLHLENSPEAENKPYVLLNLAQILAIIADHQDRQDPEGNEGQVFRDEAISLLRTLEKEFPTFPMKDQGMYLLALLLEAQNRKSDAAKIWETLANDTKSTRYVIYALIALGDHAFKDGRSGDALNYYSKALEKVEGLDVTDSDWERLRIQYRYVWAAYRATALDAVLTVGVELLTPGRKITSLSQRTRIESDTVQLIGDTLYEGNNPTKIKQVLKKREIGKFGAAIGYHVLTRLYGNGLYQETAQLGDWIADEFPLSKEIPRVLQISADSLDKLGRPTPRLHTLEKLAMLLPSQSLWRAQNKDDPQAIKVMEESAEAAAKFAANSHYQQGIASGSPQEFKSAAAYFDALLTYKVNGEESNTWRLRLAHCHYFIGDFDRAKDIYHSLKADLKVTPEILQLASYQAVQTDEKRWRDTYQKAMEKGEDPRKHTATLGALADLEKSIDDFVLRFPGQGRSLDLLLVGASANRDMDLYDQATKFWQRLLVMGGTPSQRKLALRGLIFVAMKSGSSEKVVEISRRILKTENMTALGQDALNETLGVLSTAAQDEGKRLNEQGKVLDAGLLLTEVAAEYPSLPDRDRIYRDGAYMLAIASEWGRAEKAAKGYFAAGLTKNRADMIYLLARAHEYQLRLHDSAKKYLELGEKYPSHSRSATSLERAEKLALAEGDYILAARAAEIAGEQTQNNAERLKAFTRSVEHLEKADDPNRALGIARRRLRASRTTAERLSSRILMARLTYQTGSEQEALDELEILAKQVDKSRSQVSSDDFANLSGEVYVLLGNEQKRKFEDFSISGRGGDLDANVALKSKYFEELVTYYDLAAAKGSTKWAAEARYKIASSADSLATEISSLAAKNNITFKTKSRYQITIERLQGLSRRYLSANVLAAKKNPATLKDSEWVRKSAGRLSSDLSDTPEKRYQEQLPTALFTHQTTEWSL